MKSALVIIQILVFSRSFCQQESVHTFTSNYLNCEYTVKNGMLNGKYASFYSDGRKKSEGKFVCNNRVGEWIFWDDSGRILLKREYLNNLAYNQSVPSEISVPFPARKNGFIQYTPLKEPDIKWEKRCWRKISPSNNAQLFCHAFSDSIVTKIHDSTLYVFDEGFFNQKSATKLREKIPTTSQLISFKIKEDAFVDARRDLFETRIIGICPIFKNGKDTLEAGWIYFPSLRNLMSKIRAKSNDIPLITNIDDLFHMRHFASEIYKESNVYDRAINAYCKNLYELERERERIELDLIESFQYVKMYPPPNWKSD